MSEQFLLWKAKTYLAPVLSILSKSVGSSAVVGSPSLSSGAQAKTTSNSDVMSESTERKPTSLEELINRGSVYSGKGPGGPSKRGSHRLADAMSCEVKYFYSHRKGLTTVGGGDYYLTTGNIYHAFLAYKYARLMERKPQWFLDEPDVEKAVEHEGRGKPEWIRSVREVATAYDRWSAGDAFETLACEETFAARVGDLDPGGPFPELDDEIVTCKPDLVIFHAGKIRIYDHKLTQPDNRTGRLGVINPEKPDLTYIWQCLFNVAVVRACGLDVQDFCLNRAKRGMPTDFSRDSLPIDVRSSLKVGRTARMAVKRDIEIQAKIESGEFLIPHLWECGSGKRACEYSKACHAESLAERDSFLNSNFVTR